MLAAVEIIIYILVVLCNDDDNDSSNSDTTSTNMTNMTMDDGKQVAIFLNTSTEIRLQIL